MFVPADCVEKRDTVMLLFPATSFKFTPPLVPTTHTSQLFTPLPWQILTFIIAANDLTKGSSFRGYPELFVYMMWINTYESICCSQTKVLNKNSQHFKVSNMWRKLQLILCEWAHKCGIIFHPKTLNLSIQWKMTKGVSDHLRQMNWRVITWLV